MESSDSGSIQLKAEDRGTKRPNEGNSDLTEMPQELKEMFKPLECELCDVSVTCTVMAYTHYNGKAHLKNVNAYMKKYHNVDHVHNKKKKENCEQTRCEVCDIQISSNIVYLQHIAGKQHKKNLKKKFDAVPIKREEIDSTDRFGIGRQFISDISQQDSPKDQPTNYYCNVCLIFTNTQSQMDLHKKGQKHTKKIATLKRIKQVANITSTQDSEYYNEDDVWQAAPNENEI